jgi:hypothetical protein
MSIQLWYFCPEKRNRDQRGSAVAEVLLTQASEKALNGDSMAIQIAVADLRGASFSGYIPLGMIHAQVVRAIWSSWSSAPCLGAESKEITQGIH